VQETDIENTKVKFFLTVIAFITLTATAYGQVVFIPIPIGLISATVIPEHGFLPGKKFKFYPTIDKYDFGGLKVRVELFDDRPIVKLSQTECSEIPFTNTSEFESPSTIYKVGEYLDILFRQAGGVIDSNSTDTVQVRLEGIDSRLIGYDYVRVHGLCQIKIKYHGTTKTYCIDITDADKHSPISSNAFVTRLTATRILTSASIREVIEQFFADLKTNR
jgi:hypothetical protein